MAKSKSKKKVHPPQTQKRPGKEATMHPQPIYDNDHKGSNKLKDKVALITGADSGIGRAVAILFAKEGADVAIVYLSEETDAAETQKAVESYGRKCLLIPGDITKEKFCKKVVDKTIKEYGRLNVLVNNAAIQYEQKNLEDINSEQLVETFATNIFAMFWITQAALRHLKKGSTIINTTSVTAYRGSPHLLDYSATKGAIVSFTRSLAVNLVKKGIRVNGVAPGPIWTPLIASSFSAKHVAEHGSDAPMQRPGEPVEVAPAYLFLACDDSSYMSGQIIHPNGGEIVNG